MEYDQKLSDAFKRIAEFEELWDFLEEEVKDAPILLHNTMGAEFWPKHPRGLGLIPNNPRKLIDAVRDMKKCGRELSVTQMRKHRC